MEDDLLGDDMTSTATHDLFTSTPLFFHFRVAFRRARRPVRAWGTSSNQTQQYIANTYTGICICLHRRIPLNRSRLEYIDLNRSRLEYIDSAAAN